MVLLYLFYGLLALLSLFFVYLKNGKNYWQSRGVLTKPAHFFLGHLRGVAQSLHIAERQDEFYNEFKGKDKFCGILQMNRPIAIITDLDLVRDIFVKDFSKFHDRGVYVDETSDPLTPHLFSLSGPKWNYLRNKLSPTFTSGKRKNMFPIIVDFGHKLQKILDNQLLVDKTIDAKRLCVRFTTDVISSTIFGLDTKSLENNDAKILEISNHMNKTSVVSNFVRFFINSYPAAASKLGLKIFPEFVANYFIGILSDTFKSREQNLASKRNDFVDILIKIKNSNNVEAAENSKDNEDFIGKVTFNELAATAFDFLFAGFETSSAAMSYCLLQLAINQDIQTRVHNEIHSILQQHDNTFTYEGVGEMTYLEQCFNEAMRLFPPAHSLIRETTEDYKVAGTNHVLEKGIQVLIPSYSMHRDGDIFPDPEKFDPDRFTPENIKLRHPFAFLPFGEGPRMCIGMRLGILQSKIGLASILANFRLTVNEKMQLPAVLDVINPDMGVRGGIWLDFEKI